MGEIKTKIVGLVPKSESQGEPPGAPTPPPAAPAAPESAPAHAISGAPKGAPAWGRDDRDRMNLNPLLELKEEFETAADDLKRERDRRMPVNRVHDAALRVVLRHWDEVRAEIMGS